MTNKEKAELRRYVLEGKSFQEITHLVDCSDQTIKRYIRAFRELKEEK